MQQYTWINNTIDGLRCSYCERNVAVLSYRLKTVLCWCNEEDPEHPIDWDCTSLLRIRLFAEQQENNITWIYPSRVLQVT